MSLVGAQEHCLLTGLLQPGVLVYPNRSITAAIFRPRDSIPGHSEFDFLHGKEGRIGRHWSLQLVFTAMLQNILSCQPKIANRMQSHHYRAWQHFGKHGGNSRIDCYCSLLIRSFLWIRPRSKHIRKIVDEYVVDILCQPLVVGRIF